ncbi:MAG TPA: hypothetical protein VIV40_16570 [Kofleriaceae bacterium]
MRALVLCVLVLLAGIAHADDFLKSSPGELSKSHAALDSKDSCTTCHDEDTWALSPSKCLGCHDHKDLGSEIAAGKGLHASVKIKGRECKTCHHEHRGRNFDLMGWATFGSPQQFDHSLTGWKLQGRHSTQDCARCHKQTNQQGLRTYIGMDRTCGNCHAKDTPHGTMRQRNMDCAHCHSETSWQPPKSTLDFNHDDKAQAAMALDGAHEDLACVKCHPKSAFKLTSFAGGECSECHQSPHDGQLFSTKKCQTCHSASLRTLRQVRFDHKKQTGFALLGKHGQVECASCHTKALGKRKPSEDCASCHADDNKHGTRFAKQGSCSTCHSPRAWQGAFQFNHEANTKFELTGKHATATCRACHRGKSPSDFERFDIGKGCMSCHKHEKAHGGKFKSDQCLTCHTQPGIKKQKKDTLEVFHGENSKFPLRNGHASVQCQLCHLNDVYQDTPMECGVSCHEDTLHRGSLGETCSRCHEPGQWTAVRFDHAQDTKWPLRGKHAAVKTCESCHAGRQFADTPSACASCHKSDDIHHGKLGDKCEKCHREDGANTFQHNRDAQFKIDGAHQPLQCAKCHPSMEFKPLRSDCVGCHAEPAIHKGRFGTDCARCHSTKTFGDMKAQHDVGDFSLTGAHDQLDCARCHPNGERRRGQGNLCITCHRKDDIHKNSLSPRCGECHSQRSFAPARFDHLSVGCSLSGQHATLPCADCHKNGNFGAVSPMCASCHRNEALRVKTPDHKGLIDCGSCHNPNAWVPATQLGAQSVCR